ncbi:MAG TPA: hypothetical protein VLU25_07785 [Acidobacteriota bacterium]|nr:hypothetical protein [Acidobacteriota bacterium]
MTGYDYIVYDNRTPGPEGYDWSIKIATGVLKSDRRIRRKFVEYCEDSSASPTQPLRGFGEALGGFPLADGSCLICVTLETRDRSDRNSCAFVGILFCDFSSMRTLLKRGDPIEMARSVYDGPDHPPMLQRCGSSLATAAAENSANRRGGIRAFVPNSSPKEAASLLLEQSKAAKAPPSVLGVATWAARNARSLRNYDVAFCIGLPDSRELAGEVQDLETGESDGSSTRPALLPALAQAAVLFVAVAALLTPILLPVRGPLPGAGSSSGTPVAAAGQDKSIPVQPLPAGDASSEEAANSLAKRDESQQFLSRFEKALNDLYELAPEELLATPEYKALQDVPVLARHEKDRQTMLRLLTEDLPAFRDEVKDKHFWPFFRASPLSALSPEQKAAKLRDRLPQLNPPVGACELLYGSFRFWTEREDSLTRKWCGIVEVMSVEGE